MHNLYLLPSKLLLIVLTFATSRIKYWIKTDQPSYIFKKLSWVKDNTNKMKVFIWDVFIRVLFLLHNLNVINYFLFQIIITELGLSASLARSVVACYIATTFIFFVFDTEFVLETRTQILEKIEAVLFFSYISISI